MAADEKAKSDVTTDVSTNDTSDYSTEKSGYLLKRNKITNQWKKKWFHLKDSTIYYSNSTEDTSVKTFSLEGCEIATCEIKSKNHTFYLKPKISSRKYILCAESEEELQEWMQVICLARSNGQKNSSHSEACVIQ